VADIARGSASDWSTTCRLSSILGSYGDPDLSRGFRSVRFLIAFALTVQEASDIIESGVGVRCNRPSGKMTPIERTTGCEHASHLNPSQRLHLLSSCQYADKLLSEIEATLAASQSKSPFPRFKPDLLPAQAKMVQDYIARLRAQLVRILDSQGVSIPAPHIGSLHAIRVTLGFADIAFDECRPKRMAGYGELADAAAIEMAGLVDEMQGIISRLNSYLAQGQSADLAQRLQRLEEAGSDVALVQAIQQAISQNGFIEFRPALAAIVERLETDTLEIAVFGRVSSGKSSLLNHIAGRSESTAKTGMAAIGRGLSLRGLA
jgi:hypothetical protein